MTWTRHFPALGGMGPDSKSRLMLAPASTVFFWLLAAIILLGLNGASYMLFGVRQLFSPVILLCCLVLFLEAFTRVPLRRALGTPGILFLFALGSYLFIGWISAFNTSFTLNLTDYMGTIASGAASGSGKVASYDYFTADYYLRIYASSVVLVLATALGCWLVLRRTGLERFMNTILILLTVNCLLTLATPILAGASQLQVADYLHSGRFHGTSVNPNHAAFFGCMTVALSLARFSSGRPGWLPYLALTVSSATILMTSSRTGIVVFLTLLVCFVLFNPLTRKPLVKVLAGTALVVTLVLVNGGATQILNERHMDWLGEVTGTQSFQRKPEGDLSRLDHWRDALAATLDAPLFGNGTGTLHLIENGSRDPMGRLGGSHNTYFIFWGEAGLIPLIFFLLFLGALGWLWTKPPTTATHTVAGWATVIALFCFANDTWMSSRECNFFIGVSCVLAVAHSRRHASGAQLPT